MGTRSGCYEGADSPDELRARFEQFLQTPGGDEEVEVLLRLPSFFDDVAVAVESGEVELSMVNMTFGTGITDVWAYWEKAIEVIQKNDPLAYIDFETLAKKVSKIFY